MLFRIWFQVLCKLALLAMTLMPVSVVFGRFTWAHWLMAGAVIVLLPIGVMGGALGILVFVFGWRMPAVRTPERAGPLIKT
jgi:hypothetical protein